MLSRTSLDTSTARAELRTLGLTWLDALAKRARKAARRFLESAENVNRPPSSAAICFLSFAEMKDGAKILGGTLEAIEHALRGGGTYTPALKWTLAFMANAPDAQLRCLLCEGEFVEEPEEIVLAAARNKVLSVSGLCRACAALPGKIERARLAASLPRPIVR
jgi:hypothetical protein